MFINSFSFNTYYFEVIDHNEIVEEDNKLFYIKLKVRGWHLKIYINIAIKYVYIQNKNHQIQIIKWTFLYYRLNIHKVSKETSAQLTTHK